MPWVLKQWRKGWGKGKIAPSTPNSALWLFFKLFTHKSTSLCSASSGCPTCRGPGTSFPALREGAVRVRKAVTLKWMGDASGSSGRMGSLRVIWKVFERHSWAGAAPAWARLYSRGLRQPRNAELPQPLLVETDTCAEPTDHPCPQPRVGVPALQSPRMQPWGKGESPCSWTKRRPPLLVPPSQARPRTGRAVPVAAGWTAAPRPRSASPAAAGSAAALPPLAARGQRRTGERTGGGGEPPPAGAGRQRGARGGAGGGGGVILNRGFSELGVGGGTVRRASVRAGVGRPARSAGKDGLARGVLAGERRVCGTRASWVGACFWEPSKRERGGKGKRKHYTKAPEACSAGSFYVRKMC